MVTESVTYLRSLENNVSRTARLLELFVRVPRMFQAASEALTSGENLHGDMLMALGFIGLVILGPVVLVRTEVVSALARVGRT